MLTFSTYSLACQVEVDGEAIKPQLLTFASATIVNENEGGLVLITCGHFNGTVEGVSRVAKLRAGECTIISNKNELKTFKCQESI